MSETFRKAAAAFRQKHPEVKTIEVFVTDLNGAPRGKLAPIDSLDKLADGGMKMPRSAVGLDIFGCDVGRARVALEVGDPDGVLRPIPSTLAPMIWADRPTGQVQAMMLEPGGTEPTGIDARGALVRVVDRAKSAGLTPVVAMELEFYLIDAARDENRRPRPPKSPGPGGRLYRNQIYDMDVLRVFEGIITEITDAAHALGAPPDAAICEFGAGQFEINLRHQADAVAAADHAIMLKRAIRGVARKHGMDATFMAKPYGELAGSGLHMHLSVQDADGRNIFDAGQGAAGPNEKMRHAIAGILGAMGDSMAVFAPHLNSYRRFAAGSYAPMSAAWGLDNRGAAIRAPEVSGKGARFEVRVAGADANPYLAAAVVLDAALEGLEAGEEPPMPVEGEAGKADGLELPLDWDWALEEFEKSDRMRRALGEELHRVFAAMKRQEQATMFARITDAEFDAYLRTV